MVRNTSSNTLAGLVCHPFRSRTRPTTETVAALGTSQMVFAPYFHVSVTPHVCPFQGEKFSSVDMQREEEITVVHAGEGMEWDSKYGIGQGPLNERPGAALQHRV